MLILCDTGYTIGLAIFYIIMDIAVHWGAFLMIKAQTDMLVIYVSVIAIAFIFIGERLFLKSYKQAGHSEEAS